MAEGSSVFGIMITAIVFLIILFLAYTYFLPFLNPTVDLSKEVKSGFEGAQVNEGKLSEKKELFLKKTQVINAKSLEDSLTMAVLECNDPSICCIDEENCSNALNVNTASKSLTVKKDTMANVFYRCMFEHRLFVCRAFFGIKPAQLKIKSMKAPASIDLSKNSVLGLEISLQNTGELDTKETISAKAQVFNAKDSNPLKKPLLEAVQEIKAVKAGESRMEKMQLMLLGPGKFTVKISVSGEDSGSDLKTASVLASGIPTTDCTALTEEIPEIYSSSGSIAELQGKCISKAPCQNCNTAFECMQAWLSREGIVVSASSEYAYAVLQDSQCK